MFLSCMSIGIITISNNRLNLRKDNGTVAEVFTQESVVNLRGLLLLLLLLHELLSTIILLS